jgi:hypothetical protein
MSAAHRGKKESAESNAKRRASLTGRTLSAPHRSKISAANTGRKASATPRANVSAAIKGVWDDRKHGLRPPRPKRNPFSLSARQNMSAAQKKKQAETNSLAEYNRTVRKGKPRPAAHTAAILAAKAAKRARS